MIKHTRMYELMLSKLKTEALAVPAAYAVRGFFRTKVAFCSPCKKEIMPKQTLENLHKQLNDIYKEPIYDNGNYVPLAVGDDTMLSVILPAYNSEKFLGKCLKSIFDNKPSFKFEVLVVNDGSEDGTADVVKTFSDNKELIYIEQENSGVSVARNKAIAIAKGKYIAFVDADDMLEKGAFEALVNSAEKNNCEIAVGGWRCCDENDKFADGYKMPECIYDESNMADCKEISGVPWGKVYRRELFSDVRFPEHYKSYNDTCIRFLIFRKAKRISCISQIVYIWRRTSDGITSKSKNSVNALRTYWIIEAMVADNERIGLNKDLMFYVILLTQFSYVNYNRLCSMDAKFRKLVFNTSCSFYEKYSASCPEEDLPYALKKVHKALIERDFGLWTLASKNYRMIS